MLDAGLKGNALVVYAYIYHKAYTTTGVYNSGLSEIVRTLKLSEVTVINVVKELEKRGFIEKEYYIGKNCVKRLSLKPLI
jgi:DNA-binding MarR family transcriptional regulator